MDRTIAGDSGAWQDLCLVVESIAWGVTASRRAPYLLQASKDDRLQVSLQVMDRLHDGDFGVLRELRRPGGNEKILGWLVLVATHAMIDHVREHAERLGSAAEEGEAGCASFQPAPPAIDPSRRIDARDIARELIPKLSPQQQEALCLWLVGHEPDESAEQMGLESGLLADRLMRSALKRLSRWVAEPGETPRRTGRRGRKKARK